MLGRPLFDDAIQAWGLGPAIPPLFRRFKPYLLGALDVYKLRTDPSKKLDAEELELLDWVWKKYGRYSGSDLEDITCGQAPWKEAYGDTQPPFRSEEEVTQASMKAYFLAQAKKLRRGAVKDAKAATARSAPVQARVVRVRDESAQVKVAQRVQADAGNVDHVAAPMPGTVVSVSVKAGQKVRQGDVLLAMEAMKMETMLHAERDGVIGRVHVSPGEQVEAKDLLLEYRGR